MSDQHVSKAAIYTTQINTGDRTSMSPTKFKPAIPAIKQLHSRALDCAATGFSV